MVALRQQDGITTMSANTNRREFLTWTLGAAAAVPAASLLLRADEAAALTLSPPWQRFSKHVAAIASQCVGQSFGRGECTDFVAAVLARAGGKPGNNYVWGEPITSLSSAGLGSIVQFFATRFTSPDGRSWWGTSTQHTAIVVAHEIRNGRPTAKLTLAELNVNGVRSV